MNAGAVPNFLRPSAATPALPVPRSGFRLMRYVVVTSLVAMAVFALLMTHTEHLEEVFFEDVQRDQLVFFEEVQNGFMREHDQTRQDEILRMHEAAQVNLAHVVANMLWDDTIAPFVKRSQKVPIDHCRALAGSAEKDAVPAPSPAQQLCFAKVGQVIRALPRFAELDARVRVAMQKSGVFKIKVFDLRGLTVYSSEHAQVGDDKTGNQGWKTAVGGHAASEITHRARFSAFEGVVEDRDLISSYIPIFAANNQVSAVFEIYSDVTAFLKESTESSIKMTNRIAENRATAAWVAKKNLDRIILNNGYAQAISVGLFALFYAALLLIALNGQRLMDRHALAQAQARDQERLWHREKMAALATMAANLSHEVGNPLAVITAVAEEIESERHQRGCASCQPSMVLEQTDRIVTMTREIVRFATLRGDLFEPVDVNQMVRGVCNFLGFDHRFRGIHIDCKLAVNLPARVVIPDYLNEALMVTLQDCLQTHLKRRVSPKQILVETLTRDDAVLIRVVFDQSPGPQMSVATGTPPDSRLELARVRLAELGAKLFASPTTIEISLPPVAPLETSQLS